MIKDIVYFSKVKPEAKIPTKRDEDAAYDIYACFDEDYIILNPLETKLIPTGIASACSKDYCFILKERGSTGSKGIGLRCGVLDSGYRSEWFVALTNHNNKTIVIAKEGKCTLDIDYIRYPYEKAIAQAMIIPVPQVHINEIPYEDLLKFESERVLGTLGSSNK
jgi:dUTP pyrophosphatase